MTASLIAVVAVAVLATFALSARPRFAVPGGLVAFLAWLVAMAAALPGHWLLAAGFLVLAGWCGAYTAQSACSVSAAQRAADEQAEEAAR
jgi:hypothetical protein